MKYYLRDKLRKPLTEKIRIKDLKFKRCFLIGFERDYDFLLFKIGRTVRQEVPYKGFIPSSS